MNDSGKNGAGKWNDEELLVFTKYGDEVSYQAAADMFNNAIKTDNPIIEDWGCGAQEFKKYLSEKFIYIGVDGSKDRSPDVVADLVTLKTDRPHEKKPDGILLRHVLEHNEDWENILINAINTAKYFVCVINFMDMREETAYRKHDNGAPYYFISRPRFFGVLDDYYYEHKELETKTGRGKDDIYFISLSLYD